MVVLIHYNWLIDLKMELNFWVDHYTKPFEVVCCEFPGPVQVLETNIRRVSINKQAVKKELSSLNLIIHKQSYFLHWPVKFKATLLQKPRSFPLPFVNSSISAFNTGLIPF